MPELHWLGAKLAKEILAVLLSRLVRKGLLGEEYARQVATMILSDRSCTGGRG